MCSSSCHSPKCDAWLLSFRVPRVYPSECLIRLMKQHRSGPTLSSHVADIPPPRQLIWQESAGKANVQHLCNTLPMSMYMYVGVFTGDADSSDQSLFICEQKAFHELCTGLMEICPCLGYASWRIESFTQVHVE